MKNPLLYVLVVWCLTQSMAQHYTEKKTRHRFGEMYLGFDYFSSIGGTTQYLDVQGNMRSLDLKTSGSPRMVIGGTHFWGHANFYVAIPLSFGQYTLENQRLLHTNNVETGFKFYPWRLQGGRFSPYIGIAWTPFLFEQNNGNLEFGEGPRLNHTSFPLMTGLAFRSKNHLFECGLSWNYDNQKSYYISREIETQIRTPPYQFSVSYAFLFDTTIRAEPEWLSGETAKKTKQMAEHGGLSDFYLSTGFSSAFWLQNGSYNRSNRPYMTRFPASLLLEFGVGYHLHRADMNIAVNYRGMASSNDAYGADQSIRRQSYGLEVTKNFWDYNGFVPFFGAIISREKLGFRESFENQRTFDVEQMKTSFGLSLGWDIRPNRIQSWLIRSNLRLYPGLSLDIDGVNDISFSNFEANFVQLILYPERLFKNMKKSGP